MNKNLADKIKRWIIPVIIIAAGIGVFNLLSSMKKPQKRGVAKPFIRTVEAERVEYASLKPDITSGGRVVSIEEVSVVPEVTGVVQQGGYSFRKGENFRKGDVLFRIDSRQAGYNLEKALSGLNSALANMLPEVKVDISSEYDKWQRFFKEISSSNIPSLPDSITEREKFVATRYGIFNHYYTVKSAKLTLMKHTVRAPFTGTVSESGIYPASMVRAGTPAGTILRTDVVEIELAMKPEHSRLLEKGMPAYISACEDSVKCGGKVSRIGSAVDKQMQTVPVFVKIRDALSKGLRPGMYASARIPGLALEHAFRLPRKAVHDKDKVYIIKDNELYERSVNVVVSDIESVYLDSGLSEGDIVITEPMQDAVIGMKVKPAGIKTGNDKQRNKGKN